MSMTPEELMRSPGAQAQLLGIQTALATAQLYNTSELKSEVVQGISPSYAAEKANALAKEGHLPWGAPQYIHDSWVIFYFEKRA